MVENYNRSIRIKLILTAKVRRVTDLDVRHKVLLF